MGPPDVVLLNAACGERVASPCRSRRRGCTSGGPGLPVVEVSEGGRGSPPDWWSVAFGVVLAGTMVAIWAGLGLALGMTPVDDGPLLSGAWAKGSPWRQRGWQPCAIISFAGVAAARVSLRSLRGSRF